MTIDDFAERQYFHESDRRDKLSSSASLPIGVMVGVAAFVAATGKETEWPPNCSNYFSLAFIVIATILIACFIYQAYRFFTQYTYEYIASAGEVRGHFGDLQTHHAAYPTTLDADASLKSYITDSYLSAADRNAKNNDGKSYRLLRMNQYAFYALLPCAILALLTASAKKAAENDRYTCTTAPVTTPTTPTGPAATPHQRGHVAKGATIGTK